MKICVWCDRLWSTEDLASPVSTLETYHDQAEDQEDQLKHKNWFQCVYGYMTINLRLEKVWTSSFEKSIFVLVHYKLSQLLGLQISGLIFWVEINFWFPFSHDFNGILFRAYMHKVTLQPPSVPSHSWVNMRQPIFLLNTHYVLINAAVISCSLLFQVNQHTPSGLFWRI